MTPRIKVFCFYYNEEFLIPFFPSHYQYADKFHAFVSRSSDRTRELLEADPRVDIQEVPPNHFALMARMWNVFRHRSDNDLDPSDSPVVLQRRHGIAGREGENAHYQKPIVIRPNLGLQFSYGNHHLLVDPRTVVGKLSDTHEFQGAHWQNADPSFCITRRIRDRKERQSADNLRYLLGIQHHHISEADVLQHCLDHSNDPQIF